MVRQVLNIGTGVPGSGDPAPTFGTKVNANFAELYASTPGVTGPVYFGTDSGVVNAYLFTHAGTVSASLTKGTLISLIPLNTNTGASTLNADGTGAVSVLRANGSALTGGELSSLGPVVLQSTGTQWQIVSTAGAQPGFERSAAETTNAVVPISYVYPYGNPRRQGAPIDGVTSARAALNTQNSTGEQIYLTRGTYLIDSNLTISSAIHFESGAILKIATGVVLTISGAVNARRTQIFSLVGTGIVFFTQASNEHVFPEWWYGGGGDWSVAINAAIQSLTAAQVITQSGTFLTTDGRAQKVLLGIAAYTISFPIFLTDKSTLAGSGYGSVIMTNSNFLGSAAIVDYVDFVGSVGPASAVMTVTAIYAGSLAVGQLISSGTYLAASAGTTAAIPPGVVINSLGTGTGGVGTYNLSSSLSVSSQNLQALVGNAGGSTRIGSLTLERFNVIDKNAIANTMGISLLSVCWDSEITDVTVAGFQRSGVKLDSCYDMDNRGLYVYNCAVAGGEANVWVTATATNDRAVANWFWRCKFENAPASIYGLAFEHATGGGIRDSDTQSNGFGISFMDCSIMVVDNVYLEDVDREIATLQYNGASTNSQIHIKDCSLARATYTNPILLNGCVDTIIENVVSATPGVALVSVNANASRWSIKNSPGCGATNGGVGLGQGRQRVISEDFIGSSLGPEFTITATGAGTGTFQSNAGGVYRLTTGAVNGNSTTLSAGAQNTFLASASHSTEIRARVNTVLNVNYRVISYENGAQYLRVYANNGASANPFVLETNDGTLVSHTTTLTSDTAWHVFRLEVLNGVASLWIDGISQGSVSAHVPTVAMQFNCYPTTTTNSSNSVDIDRIDIDQDRIVAP